MLSCVQESECLRVSIARAKAVVYADHLKQMDQAIEILNELSETGNPDTSFLIDYSKGCFALDAEKYSDAVVFLTAAEHAKGENFSYYRLATIRQLAIALGKQEEWEASKKFCKKAIQRLRLDDDFNKSLRFEYLELLGELAIIHWENNAPEKACGALYGLVLKLVEDDDIENPRYREVFNKVGHGLGWFISMTSTGAPPTRTVDGDVYAPVQAGLFGVRRENVGEYVPPFGYLKSLMLWQLGVFANNLGIVRIAKKIIELSLVYSDNENRNNIHSKLAFTLLVPLEILLGSPHQALLYATKARNFFAISKLQQKTLTESENYFDLNENFNEDLSDLTEDNLKQAEKSLTVVLFMPLFSKLIGSGLESNSMLKELDRWLVELLPLKSEFLLADDWIEVIEYFKELVRFWKNNKDIDEKFLQLEYISSFELFKALLETERENITLNNAFIYHVRVVISLPPYINYAKQMLFEVGRFIHSFWLNVARTQKFAVNHPVLFLEELEAISPNQGAITLFDVLTSASRAVGVNLDDNARTKLKDVRKLARPWL